MKRALALLAVAAATSLAVPAQAEPAGDDAAFLAALNQAGITYTNADRAVAVGKTLCQQMDSGTTAPDLVKQLTQVNPGFTVDGASKFAGIAASVYCPQHIEHSSGGGGT